MEKILIKTFCKDLFSSLDAFRLAEKIMELVLNGKSVELSMYGIDNVSPTFINAAFIYPKEILGEAVFRQNVKIREISQKLLPFIKKSLNLK